VIKEASDAGLPAETGFRASTQLASSGFQDAVASGSLKTVLDTIQASNFTGGPEPLVAAFAEALNAYGLERTNENLQAIGVAAQGLFKQTDFQLTELADFAKNAAVFKSANLDMSQSMAAFTALREVLPAAESGTGLRNFVNILQGANATKESRETLGRLGITPDQVDFVGENLQQVIQTLKTATAQMPEQDANVAMIKLFGRENVSTAKLLMQSPERIAELEDLQKNRQQFETDRAVAVAGMQADRNRIANQELLTQVPLADELNALDLQRRQREAFFNNQKEVAAVKVGAVGTVVAEGFDIPLPLGLSVPVPGALSVGKSVDTVVGKPVTENVSRGMLEVFDSFFRSKEDVEAKARAEAAQQHNEAMQAANRQAALLEEIARKQAGRAAPIRPPAGRPVPLAPAAAAAAAAR
jgi:hypothetical protein